MRDKLIKFLGGKTMQEYENLAIKYAKLETEIGELEENVIDDEDVLTERVRDLFNTIGPDDILQEVNGEWMVEGKKMQEPIQKILVSEATSFLASRLWDVFKRDIKYQANRVMFEDSRSERDLVAGKLMLYILDCMKTRLESLTKGRGNLSIK